MTFSGLQRELRVDTLQGNTEKLSFFHSKPVSQANSFKEIYTISFILLALGLMELYIDTANLAFLFSIRRNFSVKNRFGRRDPSCKFQLVLLMKLTSFNMGL